MFKWTDELVEELVKNTFSIDNADEVVNAFKQKRKLLPLNAIITAYELDGVIYDKCKNMTSVIAHELYNGSFKILSCIVGNFEFKIGDTVYDAYEQKRYGHDWSKYIRKIETLSIRIKKEENGNVVSSFLLVNNFYDVSRFIKR